MRLCVSEVGVKYVVVDVGDKRQHISVDCLKTAHLDLDWPVGLAVFSIGVSSSQDHIQLGAAKGFSCQDLYGILGRLLTCPLIDGFVSLFFSNSFH